MSGAGHPDDLVSAYLDGELDETTERWVAAHLEECLECRAAAADADAARSWIRTSPPGDSWRLVEGVIARRRRLVTTGAGFVAIALLGLGLLAVTASVIHPRVTPDIEELVAAHESATQADMEDMRSMDSVGSAYPAPRLVVGVDGSPLVRRALYGRADLKSAVYEADGSALSIFEQPGRLDWDELPAGDVEMVGDRQVWVRRGAPTVVIAEVGHLVVTAVADDARDAEVLIAMLPAPERDSVGDRVHDSCQRLTELFALGG